MTTKTYIIDNGKAWSDRRLYFVEADPADFEPLWTLYAKAWPKDAHTLVAIAPTFEWRVGGSATPLDWLEAIGMGLDDSVADIEAAVAFVAMARRWQPDFDEYRVFPFELQT